MTGEDRMPVKTCAVCNEPVASTDGPAICPACLLERTLAAPPAPVRLGDFELLEEVGRGGMGVVYRARQLSLDRVVAIKMLLPGLPDPESLRRFRTEATTAAALQHPNIVAIHEVGEWDGRPYLVMDYVDGRSLASRVADSRDAPPDFRRVARWMAAVADAVQHAHDRSVLHRDLKPSNVLIDGEDRPRVTDFGLAKLVSDDSESTLSGRALGSPSYMPPEQAGSGEKVSRRSDVYGLGATLYHVLTGRAPFHGESAAQVVHEVLTTEPVSPRSLQPSIPRDLETVCLKCLEKDPQRRYPSARAVAEELRRFLEGKPVLAHPVGVAGRAWRWCRRRPVLAGLAALMFTCVIAAGWSEWQLRRVRIDAAIETALDTVLRGDVAVSEAEIKNAQRQGAPEEWIHMLRGLLALYGSRPGDAAPEFEAAVARAPGSVAAKALLATGYLYGGRLDKYSSTLEEVKSRNLTPTTWQDCLFLGTARFTAVPDRASVALLEKANQMHPTGTTFLQLDLAEGFHAREVGSFAFAEKAVDHSRIAEELLGPTHPSAPCVLMNALNAALRLSPESEREKWLRRADVAARVMGPEPIPACHLQRAFYFEFTGDLQAEQAELQTALQRSAGQFSTWFTAAMFAGGRSADAWELVTRYPSPEVWAAVARAYLLLDLGRVEEARHQYEAASSGQPTFRTMAESVLLLAGDRNGVAANALRLIDDPLGTDWDRAEREFLAGRRSGPDLVGHAETRRQLCE
ncbi:MAG: serine/threonine protein kinase, partial [Acidobacteria bacterium]